MCDRPTHSMGCLRGWGRARVRARVRTRVYTFAMLKLQTIGLLRTIAKTASTTSMSSSLLTCLYGCDGGTTSLLQGSSRVTRQSRTQCSLMCHPARRGPIYHASHGTHHGMSSISHGTSHGMQCYSHGKQHPPMGHPTTSHRP